VNHGIQRCRCDKTRRKISKNTLKQQSAQAYVQTARIRCRDRHARHFECGSKESRLLTVQPFSLLSNHRQDSPTTRRTAVSLVTNHQSASCQAAAPDNSAHVSTSWLRIRPLQLPLIKQQRSPRNDRLRHSPLDCALPRTRSDQVEYHQESVPAAVHRTEKIPGRSVCNSLVPRVRARRALLIEQPCP